MDINLTRSLIDAALSGMMENIEYDEDKRFHIYVPKAIEGINSHILNPKNTWKDKEAFEQRADKLAREFSEHFDKAYGDKGIEESIKNQCPGK